MDDEQNRLEEVNQNIREKSEQLRLLHLELAELENRRNQLEKELENINGAA